VKLSQKFIHVTEDGVTHLIAPIIAIVIIAAIGGYVFLQSSKAATAVGAVYFKSSIAGKCLDDWRGSNTNGTTIDLYQCNETAAQQGIVNASGTVANANGKCLDNWRQNSTNGNPIQVYTCSPTDPAEQWQLAGNVLKNPQTGKCIDDPAFSTTDGKPLELWACNGGLNQQWTTASVSTAPANNGTTTPKPTITFSASPTTVNVGGVSTLSWNSTNATSCTASGAWSGSKPTSGSQSTGALRAATTYSLSCTGNGGTTATTSATINMQQAAGGSPVPAGTGCTSNGIAAPCVGSTTTGASGWNAPVFDDEFNGTSLDTSRWNTENGWKKNGVTVSASNETETNGNLVLTLASAGSGAEISTTAYALPVGGYAEARVNFPGNGATIYNWPAWWISGPNWPAAGENDIAEGLGTLTANYHSPSGSHNMGTIPGTWSNAFHTYGIYRQAGKVTVYWDGAVVKTYSTDDNGQPQSLILTNGCSGSCTAGAQVKVDYVRAWK
jgi:hypothetical protein